MAATYAWATPGRGRDPGRASPAWRCRQASAATPAGEAADQAAGWLPAFASALHRDARAPVNLTPIAGLERHLHRRQGDARLTLRAVREAVLERTREGRCKFAPSSRHLKTVSPSARAKNAAVFQFSQEAPAGAALDEVAACVASLRAFTTADASLKVSAI